MSLRLTIYVFLLALLVIFTASMTAPWQQPSGNPAYYGPRWEYRALRLEEPSCLSEGDVTRAANVLGREGWELVAYDRPVPPFPNQAEGTLLIVPAATGPNKDVVPQTADSFQGNIDMKMVPPQQHTSGCMLLFKREAYPGR